MKDELDFDALVDETGSDDDMDGCLLVSFQAFELSFDDRNTSIIPKSYIFVFSIAKLLKRITSSEMHLNNEFSREKASNFEF